MPRESFAVANPVASRAGGGRGSSAVTLALEARLASAERELRTQFARIAQLQAELDRLLAAFRRISPRADQ